MKASKYLFIPMVTSLILASCKERLADITVPMVDAKPVMFSFLSPDEGDVVVSITMTQPVFGKQNYSNTTISNAKVVINDHNGHIDTLKYSTTDRTYKLAKSVYPIIPGTSYTLEAFSPSGWKISGTTQVPANAIPLNEATVTKAQTGSGDYNSRFTFKWNDPAGENNFYRVGGLNFYSWGTDTTRYDFGSTYLDDKLEDGREIFVTLESDESGSNSNLQGYLITCDKNYYEYQRRRSLFSGDDPFSTPVPMYQNVFGGLGVVGSYRITYRKIN